MWYRPREASPSRGSNLTPCNRTQAEGTPKKKREETEAEEGRKAAKMAPQVGPSYRDIPV